MNTIKTVWQYLRSPILVGLACLATFAIATWALSAQQGGRDRVSDAAHKALGTPYIHMGDKVKVDTVYAGEIFYVNNHYIKPETCRVTVTNLFVDKKNQVVLHQSVFANWFREGTYEFNEIFEVPVWMPPGHYNIIKKSVSWCNNLETYTTNFDIEIDIKGPRKPIPIDTTPHVTTNSTR